VRHHRRGPPIDPGTVPGLLAGRHRDAHAGHAATAVRVHRAVRRGRGGPAAGVPARQRGLHRVEVRKPADDRPPWLVITRWRDEESFEAWVHSPAFAHGHRSAAERGGGAAPPAVGTHSELWSYEIGGGSASS